LKLELQQKNHVEEEMIDPAPIVKDEVQSPEVADMPVAQAD